MTHTKDGNRQTEVGGRRSENGALPQAALDSIYWRTTELRGHLQGKVVGIAGSHGFLGRWFLATLWDWRRRGFSIYPWGASRRDGWNICNPATYPGGVGQTDYLINCAGCYHTLVNRTADPEEFKALVRGPEYLREAMNPEATLLHISSGAARDALTPLGTMKRMSESLPGKVQIVRPFATVGPGLDLEKPFAISQFIAARREGRELRVPKGSELIFRSFSHIADTVTHALHVMVHGDGLPYDVGTETEISIRSAAELISRNIRETNRSFHSFAGSARFVPDLTRVRNHFNLACDWDSTSAICATRNYYLT